jgi:TatD DNase family protein
VFINIHTHRQLYDAKIEVVNLFTGNGERSNFYSYGIHPWHINAEFEDDLVRIKNLARESRCLAIGECGLDKLCDIDFELQQTVFTEHIKIANELNKPLIIHCVKAFNELINCLNMADNKVPVIVHGFNNNENIARILKDQGYYLSFGKALLGYESNAAKTIKAIGRKHFFLETDDADLSIKYVYRKASELLGIDEEILKIQLLENFKAVFKFEPAEKVK